MPRTWKTVATVAAAAAALALGTAPASAVDGPGYQQDSYDIHWHAGGWEIYPMGSHHNGLHIWGTLSSDGDDSGQLNVKVDGYDPAVFHVDPGKSVTVDTEVFDADLSGVGSASSWVCVEHTFRPNECSDPYTIVDSH